MKLNITLLLLLIILPVSAQNWLETNLFVPENTLINSNFGIRVAVDGDYMVIAANAGKNDTSTGSISIYKKSSTNDWDLIQELSIADGTPGRQTPSSIDIKNDYIVVGVLSKDKVYVFKNDGIGNWSSFQELVGSDTTSNDRFGESVAISENHIVVGATFQGPNSNNLFGAAYVYEISMVSNQWEETQKLVSNIRTDADLFGQRVSLYNNTIVIAARGEDQDANETNTLFGSGAVYVFELDELNIWNQIIKLTPSDRVNDMSFGDDVSIFEGSIVIGCVRCTDDSSQATGAAYVFEKLTTGNWSETSKLLPNISNLTDDFGKSVAVSQDYIAIGSHLDDKDINGTNFLSNSGLVYIYNRDTLNQWNFQETIEASDREEDDIFGYDLDLHLGQIIVGAFASEGLNPNDNSVVFNAGSAYAFEINSNLSSNNFRFQNIFVSPNPSSYSYNVELQEVYDELEVSIVNVIGEVLLNKRYNDVSEFEIHLNAKSGLYFMNIKNSFETIATIKIIKE
ncbi:T9SS type A sorting domain-containing protein [Winogradskyella litorisediminis]|uniref:Por secretion system C-terminal sorting domain-containing protein n=2 Tax=Winogradskyella TaxID=286104 RepID=A0A1M5TIR1_9FLAO|nr:T9SS type A sorting domain-containing protein [Winogradskyella jejuensis]SHH50586.1 Por secretion system C-terminal sorting domain-containing protein [Winogradskyella jejuensis]